MVYKNYTSENQYYNHAKKIYNKNILNFLLIFLLLTILLAPIIDIIIFRFQLSQWLGIITEVVALLIIIFSFSNNLIEKKLLNFLNLPVNIFAYAYFLIICLASMRAYFIHYEMGIVLNTLKIRAISLLLFIAILHITYKNFDYEILKEFIFKTFNLYNYFNVIVIIIQIILGWEITTRIILGAEHYAFRPLRFTHSNGLLRVPGLFGSALTSGVFSFLVMLFNINKYENDNKKIYLINCFVATIGICLSYSRQVYLMIGVVIIYKLIKRYWQSAIIIASVFIICITLLSLTAPYQDIVQSTKSKPKIQYQNKEENLNECKIEENKTISMQNLPVVKHIPILRKLLSAESLTMRFEVWHNVIEDMNYKEKLYNLIIGKGGGTCGSSFNNPFNKKQDIPSKKFGIDFVDNAYILILHDYGLIGLIIFILLCFLLFKNIKEVDYFTSSIKIFILASLFRMFFNSVFTGEFGNYTFWVLGCLALVVSLNNDRILNEMKYRL